MSKPMKVFLIAAVVVIGVIVAIVVPAIVE